MFYRSVVPPTRIKINSTIFDGDWRRVDVQRKISQWQLFSFYSEDLFNFIQAKHRTFDPSIFNDNPMTKSLAEESIEKTNVSSPKKTKENKTLSSFEHLYPKRKQWKRSFHFNSSKSMKNCWRKRIQSIFEIRCNWKINESKMKIEFTFRFVELWNIENLRHSKVFSPLFRQSISNKIFSNQTSNEKIFSNSNFQNLLEEEKSGERYSNQRHFRHSSSNLFQIRHIFKWWTLFYQWIFHQIRRINFD